MDINKNGKMVTERRAIKNDMDFYKGSWLTPSVTREK